MRIDTLNGATTKSCGSSNAPEILLERLVLHFGASKLGESRELIYALALVGFVAIWPTEAIGQTDPTQALQSPDAVLNQLRSDGIERDDVIDLVPLDRWNDVKESVRERAHLDVNFDYNALGFWATESLKRSETGSGVFRSYGKWDLLDVDTPNVGRLVFKLESRHKYSSVPPNEFAAELGYAGFVNPVYSNQNWRVTHLFWQQNFCDGDGILYAGFLDITDYVDVFAMASPWTGFSNLVFETGSGTIGGLPDGALGTMVGTFLTDQLYSVASVVDANADPTELLGGFDTFFNDFETFSSLEFGWTTKKDKLFLDNAHVTFWHIDAREQGGTPSGWGVNTSLTKVVAEHWLPFLRAGWADGGGSVLESSCSFGVGHQLEPGRNLTGVGINVGRPNRDTFGGKQSTQWTIEAFQRLEITDQIQLTPSLQVISDPAFNPEGETIVLFGLRLRMVL
jgi:porin